MDIMAALLHILTVILLAYVLSRETMKSKISDVVHSSILVAMLIASSLGTISILVDILGVRNEAVVATWQVRQMSDALVFALIALHVARHHDGDKECSIL